ncbi:MAG: hypothetical protein RBS49_03095 [Sphaerochaeta sp.]|jgi:hypothetical protein|nr:hypothetical protein [Sphaerochaeta sp.]
MAKGVTETYTSAVQRESYQKILILACVLLIFIGQPLIGAIVLQHISLDEGIRMNEKESVIDPDGTRIKVCSLSLSIKGPGFGTIALTHTPLFDGMRLIGYTLVFEDGSPAHYSSNVLSPQEVDLPCVWAKLITPISGDQFQSTVTIHLKVER